MDSNTPISLKAFALNWGLHEIIANKQSSDRKTIIETIQKAPEDRRVALIETLAITSIDKIEFITFEMSGHTKAEIITALATIPVDKREEEKRQIFDCVDKLISSEKGFPKMEKTPDERGMIIAALAKVSIDERENVIAHTRQLICKSKVILASLINTNNFVKKMGEIAKLPRDQREKFVENGGQLTSAQRRARVK